MGDLFIAVTEGNGRASVVDLDSKELPKDLEHCRRTIIGLAVQRLRMKRGTNIYVMRLKYPAEGFPQAWCGSLLTVIELLVANKIVSSITQFELDLGEETWLNWWHWSWDQALAADIIEPKKCESDGCDSDEGESDDGYDVEKSEPIKLSNAERNLITRLRSTQSLTAQIHSEYEAIEASRKKIVELKAARCALEKEFNAIRDELSGDHDS
jgi:hypothetical protein